VTAEESLLARTVLLPLEAALIRSGYTGYIDVSVIIDKKGTPWPLEFTSRPGWPLFQIQQALHPDPCQWMLDSLNGQDTFCPPDDIAIGVVVALPDFPYSQITRKEVTGFPVWGMTVKNRYNVHPCEMMLGEAPVLENGKIKMKPMLVTAGDYVLVASGTGSTICEAKDEAYACLGQLEIPNSPIYRIDIGCRLEEQIPKLQSLGYATSWEW
jgi:phosphoribosylamine--glycine ligase